MQNQKSTELLVVIGDVHANIGLALRGLERIENERGVPIAQVFSVGDFGLFLDPRDWDFLSGPKKYRHPELSPMIAEAWDAWRWPLALIGGNHEPWHKLRGFKPGDFGPHLTFTNAGNLSHSVAGLKVYGLSGIYHPEHLEYFEESDGKPRAASWADLLQGGIPSRQMSPKRLTYYKRDELEHLEALPPAPHLLLLHDWPKETEATYKTFETRPETHLVETLCPSFVCCGHHHRTEAFRVGNSNCRALNIIRNMSPSMSENILPGWAWVCEWDPETSSLKEVGYWPPLYGCKVEA